MTTTAHRSRSHHHWRPPPGPRERAAPEVRSAARRLAAACLSLAFLGQAEAARPLSTLPAQGGTAPEVRLVERGLDVERGIYRVDLLNEHERALTAAGVELFVAVADGTGHLRGLSHDLLLDRWVAQGELLSFDIEIGEIAEPDLWAFQPRLTHALFEDDGWIGEEKRVERVFRKRAAELVESRRLLASLEATAPSDLRRTLAREERRGDRAGSSLDVLSHPPAQESESQADRRAHLAAARGRGRQAASWAAEAKVRSNDSRSREIYLAALRQSIELLTRGTRPEDVRRLEEVAAEEEP